MVQRTIIVYGNGKITEIFFVSLLLASVKTRSIEKWKWYVWNLCWI